jgi:ATP-dependent Clp protease ATP-binding subunit ClpA
MKAAHSKSLLLVWQLTELEAKRLGANGLEPAHFLIGLAKAVDVDWIDAVNKETADREAILEEVLREMRTLREELDKLGLEPRKLRRRLRRALIRQVENENKAKLRRGAEARQAFRAAEKIATLAQSPVFPKHLLHGIAVAGSETLLGLLKQLGFETEPILKAEAWAGQKLGSAILSGGAILN